MKRKSEFSASSPDSRSETDLSDAKSAADLSNTEKAVRAADLTNPS